MAQFFTTRNQRMVVRREGDDLIRFDWDSCDWVKDNSLFEDLISGSLSLTEISELSAKELIKCGLHTRNLRRARTNTSSRKSSVALFTGGRAAKKSCVPKANLVHSRGRSLLRHGAC